MSSHSRLRSLPLHIDSRIVVVAGGTSSEREISLRSGAAVTTALTRAGWHVVSCDPAETDLRQREWSQQDIAFLALHGGAGEDGTVAAQLEQLNVRYTGSGPDASRCAFDKVRAKRIFQQVGLPTPLFRVWTPANSLREIVRELGMPLVVKPAAEGSSLGVTIAHRLRDVEGALAAARVFTDRVLIERAIVGEEWTIPVLNGVALPPLRIRAAGPFFDYAAKYSAGAQPHEAACHSLRARSLAQLAVQACAALGCSSLSRVDVMVDRAGQPWLLEVNTLPGMTATSLAPQSALAQGWSMSRLCEEVLRVA